MNYTENYQLPQWVESDRVLMKDFNDANKKMDAALKAQLDALSSVSSTRNCQVYITSYVGDGQGTRSFSLPAKPVLVNVMGWNHWMCAIPDAGMAGGHYLPSSGSGNDILNACWSGGKLTISSSRQDATFMCNWSGHSYTMVALLEVNG